MENTKCNNLQKETKVRSRCSIYCKAFFSRHFFVRKLVRTKQRSRYIVGCRADVMTHPDSFDGRAATCLTPLCDLPRLKSAKHETLLALCFLQRTKIRWEVKSLIILRNLLIVCCEY